MKAKTAMKIFAVVVPAVVVVLWKALAIFSDKGLVVYLPYLPGFNIENILLINSVRVAFVVRTNTPKRKTVLCVKAKIAPGNPVPVHTSH